MKDHSENQGDDVAETRRPAAAGHRPPTEPRRQQDDHAPAPN